MSLFRCGLRGLWLWLAAFCWLGRGIEFPKPTVALNQKPKTEEQLWMDEHWPGYQNGVNLGGGFVIENWMFMRSKPPFDDAFLQLDYSKIPRFNNNMWSIALLNKTSEPEEVEEGDDEDRRNLRHKRRKSVGTADAGIASDAMWCHLEEYYNDELLDKFAEFGINSVRVPVGYWYFDDLELYPLDVWPVPLTTGDRPYGVNPEGFVTPGTLALSNVIVKLWNRNMKVMLDMHALPGCSTPFQSYAGIECAPEAPNFWEGLAEDGISNAGGDPYPTTREKDGKTWADVYWKIALDRVVPYIKFINDQMPGAIMAYEVINEPDLLQHDAKQQAVRSATVGLATVMSQFLDDVGFGINDGTENYNATAISKDLLGPYSPLKDRWLLDIHHYFNWPAMCNVYGDDESHISVPCVREANVPNTTHQYEQHTWAGFMKMGLLDKGYRLYIGEWSAGLQVARNCNNPTKLPNPKQAQVMWRAQKFSFLRNYLHYRGLAANDQSSFFGDYYWAGRMGHNWNADPAVCCCEEDTDWVDFEWWDWSLVNLIRLGLAKPLSQMGWTPESLESYEEDVCVGSFQINCGPL